MSFQEIIQQAIARAGSRNKLARALGLNHNAPRNWVIGLALPTPEKEPALAAAAGVTTAELEDAIREERKIRWRRVRGHGGDRGSSLRKPGAKVSGRHRLNRGFQFAHAVNG